MKDQLDERRLMFLPDVRHRQTVGEGLYPNGTCDSDLADIVLQLFFAESHQWLSSSLISKSVLRSRIEVRSICRQLVSAGVLAESRDFSEEFSISTSAIGENLRDAIRIRLAEAQPLRANGDAA